MRASVLGQICGPTFDHTQARTSKLPHPTQGRPDPGQQSNTETHPHTRHAATTCRKGRAVTARELGAEGRHSPC